MEINRSYANKICTKTEFLDILSKDDRHVELTEALEESRKEEVDAQKNLEKIQISSAHPTPSEKKLVDYLSRKQVYLRRLRKIKEALPDLRRDAASERKALSSEMHAYEVEFNKKLRRAQSATRMLYIKMTKYQTRRYHEIINERKKQTIKEIKDEREANKHHRV